MASQLAWLCERTDKALALISGGRGHSLEKCDWRSHTTDWGPRLTPFFCSSVLLMSQCDAVGTDQQPLSAMCEIMWGGKVWEQGVGARCTAVHMGRLGRTWASGFSQGHWCILLQKGVRCNQTALRLCRTPSLHQFMGAWVHGNDAAAMGFATRVCPTRQCLHCGL